MSSILDWLSNPIGSAVSGIANLVGQSQANKANIQAVRETNQANRELAEYNWQQQIDMWNRQNEYNTPTAQMSRLRDAGLNPHLVYGNGVTGNNAGSTPTPHLAQMEAPRQEALRYGDAFQGLAEGMMNYYAMKNAQKDLEVKEANKEVLETQAAATSVKARKDIADMIKIQSETRGIDYKNKFNVDSLYPYQDKSFKLDLVKSDLQNDILKNEADLGWYKLELARKNLWMSEAQIHQIVDATEKIAVDIQEAYSRILLNNANTAKVNQEKSNLETIGKILGIDESIKNATTNESIRIIQNSLLKQLTETGLDYERYKRLLDGADDISGDLPSIILRFLWRAVGGHKPSATYNNEVLVPEYHRQNR